MKFAINKPDFIILIGRLLNSHRCSDDLITWLLARLFILSGGR